MMAKEVRKACWKPMVRKSGIANCGAMEPRIPKKLDELQDAVAGREPSALGAPAQHCLQLRGDLEGNRYAGSPVPRVFKTVGDAFCAVFADAHDAAQAAIEAQSALHTHLPQVRVRMALHTGTAEVREGDYFGAALNRVARLLAAGHGG